MKTQERKHTRQYTLTHKVLGSDTKTETKLFDSLRQAKGVGVTYKRQGRFVSLVNINGVVIPI